MLYELPYRSFLGQSTLKIHKERFRVNGYLKLMGCKPQLKRGLLDEKFINVKHACQIIAFFRPADDYLIKQLVNYRVTKNWER